MIVLEEIKKAQQIGKPFVAYRNPHENKVTALFQKTEKLFVFEDFDEKGFVFAPFDSNETAYILKADKIHVEELKKGKVEVGKKTIDFKEEEEVKNNHVLKVDRAVKAIQNSELSKIVISRKEELNINNFNACLVFEKLLYTYSNAYVYIWYHPKVGLWLGATPETLLKINGTKFKTMSLAGTQVYKGDLNPIWGTKELQEQGMVSDFIKNHLKKSVNNLEISDVETVRAGSLLHLRTNIKGELKCTKDISKLVGILHPTPAVCGLPKEASKKYILKNEGYKRSFYTGYLGGVNLFDETNLYVNLRCFSVINNKTCLYVGGGITNESNSNNEWLETVAKSETIKRVLY